ncbi:MAG: cytidylate kinase-like family protein, partial [bacterium]
MPNIDHIVNRQINLWNLERVAFEKRRQEETESFAQRPAELKPIVSISRQRGSRGKELAKMLSHELHYGLFDRQIIDYVSQHGSVRREVIESLDERDRSDLELWVEGLLTQRITDRDDYIRALSEVVKTVSFQGGVVILGRGANYLLSETSAYRIRTVAPESVRIRNLVESEGMSESRAKEEIKRVDGDRANYVKRYFRRNIDEPADYDMILNLASH